jgi:uncharacterized protein YkwD
MATALALALAGFALAAVERSAPASAASAAPTCENDTADAGELSTGELRKATICLINSERRAEKLDRLGRVRSLQKAAKRHAKVMVAENCFSHSCPGEPDLEERLRRAGYFEGAKRWEYAQSTGCASTAEAMVESWLARKFHRRNLLDRKFDDIGVGVAGDSPRKFCDGGFATFTAVFGWRRG